MGWVSKDFCQHTIQAHREIRGNDAPFILWRISMNTRHAAKEDMARMTEMALEQKKTNTEGSGMQK